MIKGDLDRGKTKKKLNDDDLVCEIDGVDDWDNDDERVRDEMRKSSKSWDHNLDSIAASSNCSDCWVVAGRDGTVDTWPSPVVVARAS